MPFVRIDVAEGLEAATKRSLLSRAAELFAEITESPIERVRTQVHELPPTDFAVGGVPIAESGEQAPFVTIVVLEGRPAEQHLALIERMSALVADVVGVSIQRVRVRVEEVPPTLWGIAGVPAATARQSEIASRSHPTP
jgi:4-oxalocrotonate tautomerase family enzyme